MEDITNPVEATTPETTVNTPETPTTTPVVETPIVVTPPEKPKKIKEEKPKTVRNYNKIIHRAGYDIHFLKPNDNQRQELYNSGKCFGEVVNTNATPDDSDDEVIIFVRK